MWVLCLALYFRVFTLQGLSNVHAIFYYSFFYPYPPAAFAETAMTTMALHWSPLLRVGFQIGLIISIHSNTCETSKGTGQALAVKHWERPQLRTGGTTMRRIRFYYTDAEIISLFLLTFTSWTREPASLSQRTRKAISTRTGYTTIVGLTNKGSMHDTTLLCPLVERCCAQQCPCEAKIENTLGRLGHSLLQWSSTGKILNIIVFLSVDKQDFNYRHDCANESHFSGQNDQAWDCTGFAYPGNKIDPNLSPSSSSLLPDSFVVITPNFLTVAWDLVELNRDISPFEGSSRQIIPQICNIGTENVSGYALQCINRFKTEIFVHQQGLRQLLVMCYACLATF